MNSPGRSGSSDLSTARAVIRLLGSPVAETAAALSRFLHPVVAHSGLAILDIDDVEQPRQVAGDPEVSALLTISELDKISSTLPPATLVHQVVEVGGLSRPVLATKASSGAVLVMVEPQSSELGEFIQELWQAVAVRMEEKARDASPAYLRESRVAASVRAEAVTELADRYTTTLETLLAILRSDNVEDSGARQTAIQVATEAAVSMRTASDRVLRFTEEPVTTAFERLKSDLRPLVRYRDVEVQFVEPPVDGRALPSEVAHGARAVVRGAILALLDQVDVGRVRVQWDCDGKNLLIGVRDDGPGALSADSLELESVQQRVLALHGEVTVTATTGWGSDMSVVLPLDPPGLRNDDSKLAGLTLRELEVVERVVTGHRNREIALELGISENTVKFHLSKVFRQLNIRSRAELAAIVFDPAEPAFAK